MRYSLALACAMMATPIAAKDLNVVTDFAVTHSLVSMVMGDVGQPDLLLDRGGDPHSFQLRPSQARALADADLIFWVGEDLTPWMARALSGIEAQGEVVTLLKAEGLHLQGFAAGHGHDDHGHSDHGHDDHGHDDHGHAHDDHGHDDHGHSHDGNDPHAWMNTGNVEIWLDLIADELAENDPDNAATYRANAEAARAQIAELSTEIAEILAPVGDAPLVMFHDAYGYLVHQFGVNVAGTIALGDAAAPGAQRLAELRAELQADGAVCIFPEVNHSSRYIDTVVEGTSVRVGAELDPAGVTLEPGAALYPALMRNMAQAIADCVAG
ncbi:MAG: zinc ABC transporter substrate-binding protein [Roseinatronobacter sp.]